MTVDQRSPQRSAQRSAVSPDAAPFSFEPDGVPDGNGRHARGVLLIHGFTGSPFEMRLLGEDLARRGFTVEGVKLAGHVGTTRDLAATTWHDWYRSAVEGLDRLRARVAARAGSSAGSRPRVAVCGLSMGGLLTLEMARQRGDDLAAIGVLAAPLWLPPQAESFARITSRLPLIRLLGWRAALPKLAGSDIKDVEMKRRNGQAQRRAGMPLSALASLVELGAHLRDRLGDVKTPTFLAHSEHDHTVPFACMDAIANRLGTDQYAKLVLHHSYHVITLDLERDKLFAGVADWFGRYL